MKPNNRLVDWTFNDLWRATGSSVSRKAAVVSGMALGVLLIGLVSVGIVAGTVAVLRHML